MFNRCSRAVRALFKRCSRVVRTLFALVVRTFNFQIRVACCVRVRTRCLHAVRTLLVRCSCAVRALFVRCLCERELTRELRDAPVCRAPHTVPTTRMATEPQPQPPPARRFLSVSRRVEFWSNRLRLPYYWIIFTHPFIPVELEKYFWFWYSRVSPDPPGTNPLNLHQIEPGFLL